jgi:membrane associated rhomboid family serine protease
MYGQNVNIRIGGPMTPGVKKLMIINGAIFLFQQIAGIISPGTIEQIFGLSHLGIFYQFKIWQIFTYMFLHGSWMHIIFNLLGLWMFAGELEQHWGTSQFIKYYLYCGVGAGFFIMLMNFLVFSKYNVNPLTIGASGAIYAVLLAYGMTWPNREVLLYFVIPIKIKYLVIGFGLIEFFGTLSSATGTGNNISHIGHLGGIISGVIYIFSLRKSGSRSSSSSGKKSGVVEQTLKSARLKKKKQEIETRIKAKKIIDELLAKIAKNGMSSLSDEEKKKLEWARKNYFPEDKETLH